MHNPQVIIILLGPCKELLEQSIEEKGLFHELYQKDEDFRKGVDFFRTTVTKILSSPIIERALGEAIKKFCSGNFLDFISLIKEHPKIGDFYFKNHARLYSLKTTFVEYVSEREKENKNNGRSTTFTVAFDSSRIEQENKLTAPPSLKESKGFTPK